MSADSNVVQESHYFMTQIVKGMQSGETSSVAAALNGALRSKANLPDSFLTTVKQWMDSRSKSNQAKLQISQSVARPATSLAPSAEGPQQLRLKLEDAISRGDETDKLKVLQQAAARAGSLAPKTPPARASSLAPKAEKKRRDPLRPPSGTGTKRAAAARTSELDLTANFAPELPIAEAPRQREPVNVDTIRTFVRAQDGMITTLKKLALHFGNSDAVQKTVKDAPTVFRIVGKDQICVKDPRQKNALTAFTNELTSSEFFRSEIVPELVFEPLCRAAQFGIQAFPDDVRQLLMMIAKKTRKRDSTYAGDKKYSASMPLVLACLVDRMVMLERRDVVQRTRSLETVLGPKLFKLIFMKWTLGVTKGSQFLTNLLVTWERSGWFEASELEEPRKAMWLLMAYAQQDGVADPPHKDLGTGWYKLVQRDSANLTGCMAIASKAARAAADDRAAVGAAGEADAGDERSRKRDRVLHAASQMGLAEDGDVSKRPRLD